MTDRRTPFVHPAAWDLTGDLSKDSFAVDLTSAQVDALMRALDHARTLGRTEQDMARDDFPLDAIEGDVAGWRQEVRTGRGLLN